MRAVELGMAASPSARPRKLLANLVEKLEQTKAAAGVDGGAADFEKCKRFALSVYARADRGDRARPPSEVPSESHVEAFSAAGTFLRALEHFRDADRSSADEDLATRRQYAEWRAWDLATAARERRGASTVDERTPNETNETNETKEEGADERDSSRAAPSSSPSISTARFDSPTSPTTTPPFPPPFDTQPAVVAPIPPSPIPSPASSAPRASPARQRRRSPPPGAREGERWRPDWGGGGPYAVGDSVLYSTDGEGTGFALARVVAVDQSVVPPAYVVEIDGAERSTEATRLAPPPDPRMARPSRDAVGNGTTEETVFFAGVAADGVDDAARAFVRHDVGSTRVGSTRDAFATVDEGDGRVANDDDDENRKARSTTNAFVESKTTPRLDPDARNPECRNEAEKFPTNARRERRAAFVEAHELAMRAAQFLDPERGDKRTAAECLRRALEALEAV